MSDVFKVFVENSYVGDASSISEGNRIAYQIANKLYSGGNRVQIKMIDQNGQLRASGNTYIA